MNDNQRIARGRLILELLDMARDKPDRAPAVFRLLYDTVDASTEVGCRLRGLYSHLEAQAATGGEYLGALAQLRESWSMALEG